MGLLWETVQLALTKGTLEVRVQAGRASPARLCPWGSEAGRVMASGETRPQSGPRGGSIGEFADQQQPESQAEGKTPKDSPLKPPPNQAPGTLVCELVG